MAEPRERRREHRVLGRRPPDGAGRDVFVDPYGAEVLGSLDPDTHAVGHRGPAARRADGRAVVGDLVIELGACWAIVMALTGYYLFVRGWQAPAADAEPGGGREAALAARPGRRRSSASGCSMLLVSGLPWTGVWGAQGAGDRHRPGSSMWSLDHGAASPTRPRRSTSRCRTATPATCRGAWAESRGAAIGGRARATSGSVANVDTAVEVASTPGPAAPDDGRAARRGRRGVLGDRLRLRRARRTSGPSTSTGTAARWCRRTASTTTRLLAKVV